MHLPVCWTAGNDCTVIWERLDAVEVKYGGTRCGNALWYSPRILEAGVLPMLSLPLHG